MKLVASMIVKNELGRYLPEVVGHLRDFVDHIVVLDDGSTDRTGDWLDDNADEMMSVTHLEVEDGFFSGHEGRKRQRLLDLTLNTLPDWVLNIDADEFVTDPKALRDYMENSGRQVGTLEIEEVWGAETRSLSRRMDGGWRPHPTTCFWSSSLSGQRGRRLQIANKALACGREPEAVRRQFAKARPTGSSMLHFGWANPSERRPRYERYVEADGGKFHRNSHLDSIMLPDDKIMLEPQMWPSNLYKYRPVIVQQANFDWSGGYA